MGIKEWMQKRIERNAVISELEGKKVILKKSEVPILGGEWREIHPPVDENGKWNYMNLIFGGWRNFIRLAILLLIIGFALMQYFDILHYVQELNKHCICESGIDLGNLTFRNLTG